MSLLPLSVAPPFTANCLESEVPGAQHGRVLGSVLQLCNQTAVLCMSLPTNGEGGGEGGWDWLH